jgi:hypothetical protein
MSATEIRSDSQSAHEGAVAVRRLVNDEIAAVARRFDEGAYYEFVCECGDLSCDRAVPLRLADFFESPPGSVVTH